MREKSENEGTSTAPGPEKPHVFSFLPGSGLVGSTKKDGSGGKYTWGSWKDEAGAYMKKGLAGRM